ncbi:MAG TPA: hypothetical protein VFX28_16745, partial [Methylomirabilota bacterium]|nr:hypothetical protein [Methylomirabilota bacterium]
MRFVALLRQWPRSPLAAGALASLALHGAVLVAVLLIRPSPAKYAVKRGDAIIVELPTPQEPAAAGRPAAPGAPRGAAAP